MRRSPEGTWQRYAIALNRSTRRVPADGKPDRRADDPDHAVGLHEVAPVLAGPHVDVLRQKTMVVAAGEQPLEQRARLVTAAERREGVDVPERADHERVLGHAEIVLSDVAENEFAAHELGLDRAHGTGKPRVV